MPGITASSGAVGFDYHALRDGFRRTGAIAETLSRSNVPITNQAAATSGTLRLDAIVIPGGQQISNITYHNAATLLTAGTSPHQWWALFDSSLNKLGVTADDADTAWAANTEKKLYISRSVADGVANSSTTITSATAAFTSTDVGKQVTVVGSGVAGINLGTSAARVTIASVTDATTAVLTVAASDSASSKTIYIETPFTTTYTGLYYVGFSINMTGGTMTTMMGYGNTTNPPMNLAPIIAGNSSASMGAPSTCPNPAASPSSGNSVRYYAWVG